MLASIVAGGWDIGLNFRLLWIVVVIVVVLTVAALLGVYSGARHLAAEVDEIHKAVEKLESKADAFVQHQRRTSPGWHVCACPACLIKSAEPGICGPCKKTGCAEEETSGD